MRIGLVGGTGKEGRGLALRWARAGHDVWLGSRDAARGRAAAEELSKQIGAAIQGGANAWAVEGAELVVLCVPYTAHRATLSALREALQGKIMIDITVPLQPPAIDEVHLPVGQSAALEAQQLLGPGTKVVSTLQHIGSTQLQEFEQVLEGDALVCSDDREAREVVIGLLEDLGARGLDAGPLRNAIALESMTPVLLYLNGRYGTKKAGLKITGLLP